MTKDGRHVCTDVFTVYGDDVVDRLLGQGVLVVQHTKNRAAVKLVAPLSFFWRAERGPTGPEGVKKLTVKGHYVTLVADHTNPGEVIFCTDHERYEYEPTAVFTPTSKGWPRPCSGQTTPASRPLTLPKGAFWPEMCTTMWNVWGGGALIQFI